MEALFSVFHIGDEGVGVMGVVISWQVEGVCVGSEQAGGIDRALRYGTKKAY